MWRDILFFKLSCPGLFRPPSTIVSKPKEFAHLIKNKFGSADNIAQLSKFYVGMYPERPSGHCEKTAHHHHHHHHHHHQQQQQNPHQHLHPRLSPTSTVIPPPCEIAVSRCQGKLEWSGQTALLLPHLHLQAGWFWSGAAQSQQNTTRRLWQIFSA